MLTYHFEENAGPLYKQLYEYIKTDIQSGKLSADERLPSKRSFAQNLGISTISIEGAYELLLSEGYIYALPKKGYFVSRIEFGKENKTGAKTSFKIKAPAVTKNYDFDFSSNRVESANFPFSVWAKIMREILSTRQKELLEVSPSNGKEELRNAIAGHLESFRGMHLNPDQIVIGAGTEYLYGILIKLIGNSKSYCVENPGYKKLTKIYEANGVTPLVVNLDQQGLNVEELSFCKADIAHISPTHHFPTGITMPVSRRHEILNWSVEVPGRYIIEDDYDSEFRLNGKPLPTLQSLDSAGRVIYMNTFSKSLTSTIRISYMILPEELAQKYYKEFSFYSCTVSNFEQYTLAAFISQGYFEKHINRMRLHYGRKRAELIKQINQVFADQNFLIKENDSGLHFILQIESKKTDAQIKELLLEQNINILSLSDFELGKKNEQPSSSHQFILNYSNINSQRLTDALVKLRNAIAD